MSGDERAASISSLKVLAADTATPTGSVAVVDGPHLVAEWTLRSSRTHNRRLHTAIDRLLREADQRLEDLDGFAVTAGPGSFTGVRIGLSTLKALAWVTGKPFLAVPTLDVLAAPLASAGLPVCALLDAKKQEVYAALYAADETGQWRRVRDYWVGPPALLAGWIQRPTLFCGDGWLLYGDALRRLLGDLAVAAPAGCHAPRAAVLGFLAAARFAAGDVVDPLTAVPVYVRASEAELKFPHLVSP